MKQQTETIISRHKIIFDQPPQIIPNNCSVDAPLLGNGFIGISISGDPEFAPLNWHDWPLFQKWNRELHNGAILGFNAGYEGFCNAMSEILEEMGYEKVLLGRGNGLVPRFLQYRTQVAILQRADERLCNHSWHWNKRTAYAHYRREGFFYGAGRLSGTEQTGIPRGRTCFFM